MQHIQITFTKTMNLEINDDQDAKEYAEEVANALDIDIDLFQVEIVNMRQLKDTTPGNQNIIARTHVF